MPQKLSVGVISLGCAKNRIDTEELLGLLNKAGYRFTLCTEEADIIIVNTCAFIADARHESLQTIREVSELRKTGKCRLLAVTGCMPQKYRRQLQANIQEIDLLVGVHSYRCFPQLLKLSLNSKARLASVKPPPSEYHSAGERILTMPGHSTYLRIAEGCNNRCHYCIIPGIRGPYRSRSLESVTEEAEVLALKGTREINLIAQDTTYYGRENGGKPLLPELLKRLSDIRPLRRIRLLYAHPSHLDEETMQIIASENKICSYIDIPLQHINSRILKEMGRNYTREDVIKLVKKLRNYNIVIRSTFMVGFPGETQDDFHELLSFLEEYPLDRVGAFTYSPEKGTPSYKHRNHIHPALKEQRYNLIMAIQKRISHLLNRNFTGKYYTVMVEDSFLKKGGRTFYRGRTEFQAPEVDGSVIFDSDIRLRPGQMTKVKIFGCGSYDLLGKHRL